MNPPCPRCGVVIVVSRPTLLMADNSAPAPRISLVRGVGRRIATIEGGRDG
jgi:hypothetical protein